MNAFLKKYGFSLAASGLFLVLLLIVFRGFVFDSSTLMLNSDQLNSLGSRILRAQNAVLTEWDDSRLGGVPTIDALFGDAYHPLVWVQFITDPARAVGFKFILTIWVAFCSAMLLARSITKSDWFGALLGFLYAFAPQYFTYVYGGHDGKMMVFAVAPLALLAIRKIVKEGKLAHIFVLAFCIVWMILGSHLQLTYLFLWGAGLYALYEMLALKAAWKVRGIRLGLAAVALGFGLAMSSFQILPPYLYTTQQSVRGTGEKTNYGHAVSWSLHQEELGDLLIPSFLGVDVYEQDEKTGKVEGSSLVSYDPAELRGLGGSPFYWGHNPFKLNHDSSGAVLTFLAFLCFFVPGKRRYAAFWFMGSAIALSYAMGAHSPLFKLWFAILPGVKNFRAPSMALFWLPLVAVMMAAPVLAIKNDAEKSKHLIKGVFLFAVLLVLTTIARFSWETFLGPVGLVVAILYGGLFVATVNLADNDKKLSASNIVAAITGAFKGSSKLALAGMFLPFLLIGVFMLSGQNLLNDPVAGPYFKPLNFAAMKLGATKMLPGLVLVLVVCTVTVVALKKQLSAMAFACILAVAAGVELWAINGAFVQNVPYSNYIQPSNNLIAAYKQQHPNPLDLPRVLSLSRNNALSGNIFPAYDMRNADGFHDNELASYRNFRGGQNNENYFIGINDPTAAHPFLDVENIAAVIFDSRQGTTYMPNPTALGEAFLYGSAVAMDDDAAIATLKTAVIRKEKPAAAQVAEASSDSTAEAASDSVAAQATEPEPEQTGFFYREQIILNEAPQIALDGQIPNGHAKLVERPKMDTQVFEVESDRNAVMLVTGNYHPYWKATVNGEPAKVYKAFGTLRAVEVPKGKSTVRMEYRSEPFHTCLKVSLAAFLVFIAAGLVLLLAKKRKE